VEGTEFNAPESIPAYSGEARPRAAWRGLLLNLVAPGLGYAYLGKPREALMLALLSTMPVVVVLAGGWVTGAFMLKPLGMCAMLWLWLQAATGRDLIRVCRAHGDQYILRPANSVAVYIAVVLLVTVPALLGALALGHYTVGTVAVEDHAMFPRLVPGDRLYYDKRAFLKRAPARGELVVADVGGRPAVLRVIGVPGDEVAVAGPQAIVGGRPLSSVPFARVRLDPALAQLDRATELGATREFSPDTDLHYAVFHDLDGNAGRQRTRYGPVTLRADQFVLLGDRRDALEGLDSRALGPILRSDILGAPRHVFWSRHPVIGVRWERAGLSPRRVDPGPQG
jgi:signal peptidase I